MHCLDAGRLPVKIWNALTASTLMPRQQSFLAYRQPSSKHVSPAAAQHADAVVSMTGLVCNPSATLHHLVCQQCEPHMYSGLALLLHVPCHNLCQQQDMPMSHSHQCMPCSEARCLRKDQRQLGGMTKHRHCSFCLRSDPSQQS